MIRKIKKHWPLHDQRSNTVGNYLFLKFFSILRRIVLAKIEMSHFSNLYHSIDIFTRYKIGLFRKPKNIGHLKVALAYTFLTADFVVFSYSLLDYGLKDYSCCTKLCYIRNQHRKLSGFNRISNLFE